MTEDEKEALFHEYYDKRIELIKYAGEQAKSIRDYERQRAEARLESPSPFGTRHPTNEEIAEFRAVITERIDRIKNDTMQKVNQEAEKYPPGIQHYLKKTVQKILDGKREAEHELAEYAEPLDLVDVVYPDPDKEPADKNNEPKQIQSRFFDAKAFMEEQKQLMQEKPEQEPEKKTMPEQVNEKATMTKEQMIDNMLEKDEKDSRSVQYFNQKERFAERMRQELAKHQFQQNKENVIDREPER